MRTLRTIVLLSNIRPDPQHPAYQVAERDGQFEVCGASGRVIIVCRDQHSALHYASLLNEAYRNGYKAGYRDARKK